MEDDLIAIIAHQDMIIQRFVRATESISRIAQDMLDPERRAGPVRSASEGDQMGCYVQKVWDDERGSFTYVLRHESDELDMRGLPEEET